MKTKQSIQRVLGLSGLVLALSLLAPGCGGGGGTGPGTASQTVNAPAVAAEQGTVSMANISSPGLSAGVPMGSVPRRAVLKFDLSQIPAGARVTGASLTVFQSGTTGDPFGKLGDLIVDHIASGGVFDRSLFVGHGIKEPIEDFLGDALKLSVDASPGPRTMNVTRRVAADLAAGRTSSQYRIRFEREIRTLFATHSVRFQDGTNGTPPPVLEVTYEP